MLEAANAGAQTPEADRLRGKVTPMSEREQTLFALANARVEPQVDASAFLTNPPPAPSGAAPTVISLFSGCGGLDLGFAATGFRTMFAADNDRAAVAAYSHNLGHNAMTLDVLDPSFAREISELEGCDVLLGGFPCQGFSKAGPKNQADERNSLYQAMVYSLKTLQPKMFIAENVDGLAQNYSGNVLEQVISDCSSVGYMVCYQIVDAAWFGVPQHRRRIIIVGIRDDLSQHEYEWPVATHKWVCRNGERAIHNYYDYWSETLREPITLGEAISGITDECADHVNSGSTDEHDTLILAQVSQGQKLCNARHDATSVKTWDVPSVYGDTTNAEREILDLIARNRRHKKYGSIPNGNPLALDVISSLLGRTVGTSELDVLVEKRFLKVKNGKWDLRGAMFASGSYKRPLLNEPSPTILTVFEKARYVAHPTEPRAFTVREVARIQTFPDWFRFGQAGIKPEDSYRLIGNAVPPLLAVNIARGAKATLAAMSATGVTAGELDVVA